MCPLVLKYYTTNALKAVNFIPFTFTVHEVVAKSYGYLKISITAI